MEFSRGSRFSLDERHIAIVDSRPISYLESDDVLVGHRLLNLPDNLTCYEEDGLCDLQRRVVSLWSCTQGQPVLRYIKDWDL